MTPVWKDSVLVVPHNRAMKQKWLVTATDITPNTTGGTPFNYRDDAIAFGLNITSTGESATGSVWIEYNVEFASPRVPEPIVNASVVNSIGAVSVAQHSGYTCPVDPGQSFYITSSSGVPSYNSGYTQLDTGETNGVSWTLVKREDEATTNLWGTLTGLSTNLVTLLSSENLNSLIKLYKSLTIG